MKNTSLHDVHARLGAHFTDFGGWDMPLKYGSELAEHHAVRQAAGIFDLSHMGEVRVTGPGAADFLDYALLGRLSALVPGKAKYSLILDELGGMVDDLITYRLGEEEFLVVPNAGNADLVAAALRDRAAGFEAVVTDESAETALIAVQGPNAEAILQALAGNADAVTAIGELRYYAATPLVIGATEVLLARTGYTGEDGFELYVAASEAAGLWAAITEAGRDRGLVPAGLAARDSLRLEAGMPLYGNELSRDLTPFAAGMGRMIPFKSKGDFVGRAALEGQRENRPERVLLGLVSDGRRAARAGYAVKLGEKEVGTVTSGVPSPTLGYPIAMAYVDSAYSEPGTELDVDVRGKSLPFRVVVLPFYTRES